MLFVTKGDNEFIKDVLLVASPSDVEIVNVQNSLEELGTVTSSITRSLTDSDIKELDPVQWGPDVNQNRVLVKVRGSKADAQRVFDETYGTGVVIVEQSTGALPRRFGRNDDTAPFWGGDQIRVGSTTCSSGPGMRDSSGTHYALSAGHCGPNGSIVKTHGIAFGTVTKQKYANGGLDVQAIKANTGAYVWRNGGKNYKQAGELYPAVGASVCASGFYTGEICGVQVKRVNVCVKFADGVTTCNLDEAFRGSITVAQDGDSGGPVYGASSSSSTYIAGTIVGGYNSDQTVYFQQIEAAEDQLGLYLLT